MTNNIKLVPKEAAQKIIRFSKKEAEMSVGTLLLLVKDLSEDTRDFEAPYWSWPVVKYIQIKTNTLRISNDADSSWIIEGVPTTKEARNSKILLGIRDPEYIHSLLMVIEDIDKNIPDRINKFLQKQVLVLWQCQGCPRRLGNKLTSYKEIRELISKFSNKRYRKCNSCKLLNWFEIDEAGVIHFFSGIDRNNQ